MKRDYTTRLFYKKYPYRLMLERVTTANDVSYSNGWTHHGCKTWLVTNGVDHRIYSSVRYKGRKRSPSTTVVVTASIFLLNKDDFDQCVSKWQDYVKSATVPYDESHVDVLKDNTSVIIRERLLYKKYRYVIDFSRKYGESLDDLIEWVSSAFAVEPGDVPPKLVTGGGWYPRLYLVKNEDLILTKLTWSERIHKSTMVYTYDELGKS